MTVKEAIEEIIKLRGLLIFNDYNKFKAMLLDFGNSNQKELNVFKTAVDEKILKLCIDDSLKNSQKITKIKIQLEDKGFSDKAIDFVIESFAFALGWNYTPRQPQSQKSIFDLLNPMNWNNTLRQSLPQTQRIQNQQASNQTEWTCSCGTVNTVNFCGNCGSPKPVPKSNDWICICGTINTTNFCVNCGKKENFLKNAKVGDYVKFGNYPQSENGNIQPIEWQVLAKEGNIMLVLSKYGLYARCFDYYSKNNWRYSNIRKWLNNDFYIKSFNEKEKKYIKSFDFDNVYFDNVFLLSKEEAETYFSNNDERKCKATEYAVKNGASVNSENGCSWWWLRSPYSVSAEVYCVNHNSCIDYRSVGSTNVVVRPALWINI